MIIFIGGVSCTGKTVMAQRLLEKYNMPYLSLDHLKMGLIRGHDNCGFSATDDDETIAAELWPIVKGMAETCLENNQNMIVEGCYVLPELVAGLHERYGNPVVSVYILFSKGYMENHLVSGILKHRDVIEKRLYEEDRTLDRMAADHNALKKKCIFHVAQYVEIQSDYETEMETLYQFIDGAVKRSCP